MNCWWMSLDLLLSKLCRSSFISALFVFNASLNEVAPVPPMLLAVDMKRMEKSELLMDVFCVSFFLSLQFRLSSVSVVFDINDSLNDIAPVSSISLPVDAMRKEKSELLTNAFCVSSFFCIHSPDRV